MDRSPIVTLDSILCHCGKPLRVWKVYKEGPTKGQTFYKCALQKCQFWQWAHDMVVSSYDPQRFKPGACYRCGFYGCEITDCDRKLDWFGHIIPNEDEEGELVVTMPVKK